MPATHLFNGIFFDPATREVFSAVGNKILPEQEGRVLDLLLRNRSEPVSREAIRAVLWGEKTHVSFDIAINRIINRLRCALGDTQRPPRWIRTIPKRGYVLADIANDRLPSSESGAWAATP